jgi:hypothetical protein
MLKIDRLRLSLPAGYEPRAKRIAALVAAELADRLPAGAGELRVDRLVLPAVNVAHGASDRQVAGAVASAIAGGLSSKPRGGKP